MKVDYRTFGGSTTTAYIDDTADADGWHIGTNKHSDAPVTVRWNETRHEWVEMNTPEYKAAQSAWWANTRNWM